MTNTLRILVLLAVGAAPIWAGPIGEAPETQPFDAFGQDLSHYSTFLELEGPVWLLRVTPGAFDSMLHYAKSEAAPAMIDPLADEVAVVPEPHSITLIALGLAVLALLGLRRRRHDL